MQETWVRYLGGEDPLGKGKATHSCFRTKKSRQGIFFFSFCRASFIAQLVQNQPTMQETPVRFLGQEDPLEKGEATHSSILGLPFWLSW